MKFVIKVIKNVSIVINDTRINFRSCLKYPDEYGVFKGKEIIGSFNIRTQAKRWVDSGEAEKELNKRKTYVSIT